MKDFSCQEEYDQYMNECAEADMKANMEAAIEADIQSELKRLHDEEIKPISQSSSDRSTPEG